MPHSVTACYAWRSVKVAIFPQPAMQALSLHALTKTYKNGVQALKGISLEVQPGEFIALLGPNGAGKTTAIGIVTSLVNKTGGQVTVFGHDIDTDIEAAKSCIGLVPQEINFNQFEQVGDIVVNQGGFYGLPRRLARERAEKYLRQLSLWDKRHDMSRMLSGGMKRRLMIARALVHEPQLLILDEPTAGVDIEVRRSMWDFLKKINREGITIILTTHYLEEAENLCQRVAIIDHGEIIVQGRTRDLLEKLHSEVFILNLREPLRELRPLDGYAITQVDDTTLEVEVNKSQNVNTLFDMLSKNNIQVLSMRNKVNRLEELFVRLVKGKG